MAKKSYLEFVEFSKDNRKTGIVMVRSARSITELGMIRWYSPWRRYTFWPTHYTLFDSGCLKEIMEKIDSMMKERSDEKKV